MYMYVYGTCTLALLPTPNIIMILDSVVSRSDSSLPGSAAEEEETEGREGGDAGPSLKKSLTDLHHDLNTHKIQCCDALNASLYV